MESLSGDARQMVAFRSLSIINTWPIETKSAIMSPPTEHCRAASRKAFSLMESCHFRTRIWIFELYICDFTHFFTEICVSFLLEKLNSNCWNFLWPHYTLLPRASSLYGARKLCSAGFSIISLIRLAVNEVDQYLKLFFRRLRFEG